MMSEKTVLVLGGSYFIGLAIVRELADCGYKVYTLNRGSRRVSDSRVKNIVCDRNDGIGLKAVLNDISPSFVVDVSCLNGSQAELLCEALDTTRLEAFVFLSSSAGYKTDKLMIPFKESDAVGRNSYWLDYGTNKITAEGIYKRFLSDRGIRGIILRPPYMYGENNYVQRESFIFEHALTRRIVLVPQDDPLLHFCYAPDLAMLVCCMLERNDLTGVRTYNVGDSFAVRAVEWVDLCSEAIGRPVRVLRYDYKTAGRNVRDFFPFYDYDNVLDVTKIKSIYGIETSFEEGLRRAAASFVSVRSETVFKPLVTENEKAILKELGIDE